MTFSRLATFYLLFYGALGAGVLLRAGRGWSPRIMRWTIILLEPWLFFYSLWVMDLSQIRHFTPIPLLAVALILLPLGLTPLWVGRFLPRRSSQGSFILAASFSNIGTTGGAFLCYLLFGQQGLSLAYLFLLPYPFLIFTLGFSLARRYARQDVRMTFGEYLLALLRDPVSVLPLLAMGAGAALNFYGWRPPAGAAPWVDILIKADIAVMCLAIGMTLNPPRLRDDWRAIAANGVIKFIALPALTLAAVLLIYGSLNPLPARVLLIQAAMPSAIYAVIAANLFDLDLELANTLWITTTLMLAPVALILFLLAR
jgi:malate permease and related proteins